MKKIIIAVVIIFIAIIGLKVILRINSRNTTTPQTVEQKASTNGIFEAINASRSKQGMPVLATDEKLCAYAQRRANQYRDQGETASSIFQSDGNNTEIMNTYFKDFVYTSEARIKAGIQSDEELANNLGPGKLSLTHGCLASTATTDGTGTWEVFIGATKK